MKLYLKGKDISSNLKREIGKGGEADVFDIGGDKVLKLFKQPDHIDYTGQPVEQEGARRRLAEYQSKLRLFPKNLPERVISPEDLVTDKTGQNVLGYTMRYIENGELLFRYSEQSFRQANISNEAVVKIFNDLHLTLSLLHQSNVIRGDSNDLNILVVGVNAYLIDVDSSQFGNFFCRMFTAKFLDPTLCDPKSNEMALAKPYTPESDWYAYLVMLMKCLLFVDPYGGAYLPKNKVNFIPHDKRPLHRVTVFNPEVRYPKPAVPCNTLPDDLLDYFHQVFEKDLREKFPLNLLDNLKWSKCQNCGTEHARNVCPNCAQVAPAAVKSVTVIRGEVTATRIFKTTGMIIFAAFQKGSLRWLYYENNHFKREDKTVVAEGKLDSLMRFRLRDRDTLIGQRQMVLTFRHNQPIQKLAVNTYGSLPLFDANEDYRYWIQSGQLLRDGDFGPEYVGEVLTDQTLFWVGSHFGFGFYRAGNICVAFVFSAKEQGINDTVKIFIRGKLVDSTCFFTKDYCWFLVSTQISGHRKNQCFLVDKNGNVLAEAEAEDGDGSWLGTIRGKCAFNRFLLAATDEGIVRVEQDGKNLIKTREFPDTEPFINTGAHLFPGKEGVYVVDRKVITLLKIV